MFIISSYVKCTKSTVVVDKGPNTAQNTVRLSDGENVVLYQLFSSSVALGEIIWMCKNGSYRLLQSQQRFVK